MRVEYTNWRGEKRIRNLNILSFTFGHSQWHPEDQWLVFAEDEDDSSKGARLYALSGCNFNIPSPDTP